MTEFDLIKNYFTHRQLESISEEAKIKLNTLLERADRLRRQQPKDKNKLYALHAPEVDASSWQGQIHEQTGTKKIESTSID